MNLKKWIPLESELRPPMKNKETNESIDVLITDGQSYGLGYFDGIALISHSRSLKYYPTHWTYLPDLPVDTQEKKKNVNEKGKTN